MHTVCVSRSPEPFHNPLNHETILICSERVSIARSIYIYMTMHASFRDIVYFYVAPCALHCILRSSQTVKKGEGMLNVVCAALFFIIIIL